MDILIFYLINKDKVEGFNLSKNNKPKYATIISRNKYCPCHILLFARGLYSVVTKSTVFSMAVLNISTR